MTRRAGAPHPGAPRGSEAGQASVEYLLVGLVLIALVVAVGALWHAVSDGAFAEAVEEHVSHSLEQAGGVADALMY